MENKLKSKAHIYQKKQYQIQIKKNKKEYKFQKQIFKMKFTVPTDGIKGKTWGPSTLHQRERGYLPALRPTVRAPPFSKSAPNLDKTRSAVSASSSRNEILGKSHDEGLNKIILNNSNRNNRKYLNTFNDDENHSNNFINSNKTQNLNNTYKQKHNLNVNEYSDVDDDDDDDVTNNENVDVIDHVVDDDDDEDDEIEVRGCWSFIRNDDNYSKNSSSTLISNNSSSHFSIRNKNSSNSHNYSLDSKTIVKKSVVKIGSKDINNKNIDDVNYDRVFYRTIQKSLDDIFSRSPNNEIENNEFELIRNERVSSKSSDDLTMYATTDTNLHLNMSNHHPLPHPHPHPHTSSSTRNNKTNYTFLQFDSNPESKFGRESFFTVPKKNILATYNKINKMPQTSSLSLSSSSSSSSPSTQLPVFNLPAKHEQPFQSRSLSSSSSLSSINVSNETQQHYQQQNHFHKYQQKSPKIVNTSEMNVDVNSMSDIVHSYERLRMNELSNRSFEERKNSFCSDNSSTSGTISRKSSVTFRNDVDICEDEGGAGGGVGGSGSLSASSYQSMFSSNLNSSNSNNILFKDDYNEVNASSVYNQLHLQNDNHLFNSYGAKSKPQIVEQQLATSSPLNLSNTTKQFVLPLQTSTPTMMTNSKDNSKSILINRVKKISSNNKKKIDKIYDKFSSTNNNNTINEIKSSKSSKFSRIFKFGSNKKDMGPNKNSFKSNISGVSSCSNSSSNNSSSSTNNSGAGSGKLKIKRNGTIISQSSSFYRRGGVDDDLMLEQLLASDGAGSTINESPYDTIFFSENYVIAKKD